MNLKQIERMDIGYVRYVSCQWDVRIWRNGENRQFEEAARIFEAENELNGYADLDGEFICHQMGNW